jgi:hypothetical protein
MPGKKMGSTHTWCRRMRAESSLSILVTEGFSATLHSSRSFMVVWSTTSALLQVCLQAWTAGAKASNNSWRTPLLTSSNWPKASREAGSRSQFGGKAGADEEEEDEEEKEEKEAELDEEELDPEALSDTEAKVAISSAVDLSVT